ncbi:ATP-binding protein [Agrobacterium tumefaciens]|uniref:ATP-binding protein n=1 Tax=Agrobacterium tumefaciens TaxID=358 RepID=UPI0021D31183|nr:ATP-binding protein [Agrobacterium tumefaciens]UXS00305.1 PAS domain S-box protein [Agrobacterium tumefaciens]
MPAVQYPFIDIAVHERVREGFGRGEAMALFSMDLETVLWANGRGAALFGTPMVYDFLEQGPKRQDVTFRQLSATAARLSGIGESLPVTIRINSGFKSLPVRAKVEVIEAELGQSAILFSAFTDQTPPDMAECARRMIEGFDDPDIHMAVLDDRSAIIAASTGFSALGITPSTARTLVSMASGQSGRLVKRPVPTGKGYLPAATGQITQSPELNLLFVVETALGRLDPVSDFGDDQPLETITPPSPVASVEDVATPTVETTSFASILDAVADIEDVDDVEEFVDVDEDTVVSDTAQDFEFSADPTESDDTPSIAISNSEDEQAELILPTEEAEDEVRHTVEHVEIAEMATETTEAPIETVETKMSPVSPLDPDAVVGDETDAVSSFVFNPTSRASRFVWKIDAEGRFSSISHEFAEAVGAKAAAVDGMNFADVAALFNLDTDGKIRELLGRRDTWSGKTIYWPVENTSLVVPIDLAALPTYTRSREFDGFRGFGIVRLADAVEDPHAIGLTFATKTEAPTAPSTIAADEESQTLLALPEEDDVGEATVDVIEENSAAAFEDDAPADVADDTPIEDTSRDYTPPEFEVPVLDITPTPGRRYSDKVVQLEERRARSREALSASEQAAFREIGRTLAPTDHSDEEQAVPAREEEAASAVSEPTEPEIDTGVAATSTEQSETSVEDAVEAEEEDLFADYVRGEQPAVTTAATDVEASEDEAAVAPATDVAAQVSPSRTRSSDSLTAETLDQMPVALLVHAGERLIHANPDFLRLTGYDSTSELEEVGGLDALLQRQDLEGMPGHEGGMVIVNAENDVIPVKARLQSIRWEETTALMLSLIPTAEPAVASIAATENTAETEDESLSALQGEVEELHSILETATDGVVLLGDEGEIRSLNRSASALFNYDNDEIAGKPFVTLFAHESQRAVLDYLSGLANNGVASVLNDGREVIGREASGGFLPLFMTIGRLKSSHGYCAVIRDITQWKRTEEELRNAKRAAETANAHKTDFLARVSHEIRTPLNAIIGFSDLMATERFGPIGHPRYVEYSNDIGRSGRHVLDIVNDLLDISKIEAGQMDVDFVAVALNETVAEAVSLVQPQANNQRVIIRTALSQSVPQIVADLRSIKQIVLNILSNAIRFTPSGGQIVVSTAYEANGSVTLRIRDTGIGMTRAELDQAMKPFRQVASSGKRVRGDGTGLGLPLTKAMVDANRANFSITSTPNEGTLVEITFPSQRVLAN